MQARHGLLRCARNDTECSAAQQSEPQTSFHPLHRHCEERASATRQSIFCKFGRASGWLRLDGEHTSLVQELAAMDRFTAFAMTIRGVVRFEASRRGWERCLRANTASIPSSTKVSRTRASVDGDVSRLCQIARSVQPSPWGPLSAFKRMRALQLVRAASVPFLFSPEAPHAHSTSVQRHL